MCIDVMSVKPSETLLGVVAKFSRVSMRFLEPMERPPVLTSITVILNN